MYKVQKRGGSMEDFDRNKVIAGVVRAGGTPEDAQKVVAEVEAWLPTVVQDNMVASTEIRAKALSVLGQVNPDVAKQFEGYKKEG